MPGAAKGGGGLRSRIALLAVSAAILTCPLLPALPGPAALCGLLLAGAVLVLTGIWRIFGLFLAVFTACLLVYQARLADRLDADLAGGIKTLRGTVSSNPVDFGGYLRFRFEPDRVAESSGLPAALLVSWYRDWPDIRVGQRWELELRLRPPWGVLNFHGPDKERWLFSEGVGGQGSVRRGKELKAVSESRLPLQRARSEMARVVSRQVGGARESGVVKALAVADRSGITREDQQLLRVTGTAHLLAISGLHIGLAAAGGLIAGRVMVLLLPLRRLGGVPYYLVLLTGASAAASYAALANLGVSTVRALLMLLAATAALSLGRSVHPFRVFLVALVAVLATNPFAPLGSGFWFSFLAVLALLVVFQPRYGSHGWWKTALTGQAAVFLVLLPINAAWYGGISLTALPANLFAIPWVSMLTVPAVFGGILLSPASEGAAGVPWSLAGLTADVLFRVLERVASLQPGLLGTRPLSVPHQAAAVAGGLLLLFPRGIKLRWLGVFLLLPLALPAGPPTAVGSLRVDALDVGQGTAIAVSTADRTLLYDTGPGDGSGLDHVSSVIVPHLRALGRRAPDRVILSHSDLDHTGGLHTVRARFPGVPVSGSVGEDVLGVEKCVAGTSWLWEGFEFRVLHPSGGLPYLRNNSSCVLAIGDGNAGLLLPGDVDSSIERRLLLDGLGAYPLLLAPHHGSASSSDPEFIDRVAPRVTFASAGLGNRFGFPRDEVRARYLARGSEFWSTGLCGGLGLVVGHKGQVRARSARNERRRIWRWPAAEHCP